MNSLIIDELYSFANPEIAKHSQRFFKTEKGEYGEGDIFLGIRVPELRKIAKKNLTVFDQEIIKCLNSKYHEARLTGLFVWVYQFEKAETKRRKEIFYLYLANIKAVNNWDLVDTTTPQIIGTFLTLNPNESRSFLYQFAESKNIWKRRISIIATYSFIRVGEFDDAFLLAKKLLYDKHDLIHKATGWMLREIGKRDEIFLIQFLEKYSQEMPRTMLRYSTEKLSENIRKYFYKKQ